MSQTRALCLACAVALSWESLAVTQTAARSSPGSPHVPGTPPYTAIEVAFKNAADNVELAGTLTIPNGPAKAPAVLLGQRLGLEPFDRDYTRRNAPTQKSFLAIADALSRRGIVVLRIDDRGAGGSSGQKHLSSVTQLAGDLVAGAAFLKSRPEVDPKRIGIVGHSFAGLTAPLAAVRSDDVAFVVTLAALFTDARANLERLPPGLRAATTATWTALAESSPALSPSELEGQLRAAFMSAAANVSEQERAAVQAAMGAIVTQWATPLRRSQAATDPGASLRALKKPVLAIHGASDRDLDATANLGPLMRYLGEAANSDVTVAVMPGLDHWMWVCTRRAEAGKPCDETQFSPQVVERIASWIREH